MKKVWYMVKGKLIPSSEYTPKLNFHANIVGDIPEPFVSPVDGSFIRSRSDLREHNRRNKVEQVGNDPAYMNPKPPESKPLDGLYQEISDRMNEPKHQFRNMKEARKHQESLQDTPVPEGDYMRMEPDLE